MRLIFTALAILLLGILAQDAHACSCLAPLTAYQEFDNAEGIFAGRVVSRRKGSELGRYVATLEVSESWKGPRVGDAVQIPTSVSGCGFSFQVGREYLVYASLTPEGRWATSRCSRTQTLEAAQKDREALNYRAGRSERPPTLCAVEVTVLGEGGQPLPGASVRVFVPINRITSGPRSTTVETDTTGVALVDYLEYGFYVVSAELPCFDKKATQVDLIGGTKERVRLVLSRSSDCQ